MLQSLVTRKKSSFIQKHGGAALIPHSRNFALNPLFLYVWFLR